MEEFQYNYCFGGTEICGFKKILQPCFNTTIVSVEHNSDDFITTVDRRFQYNYCFGGTLLKTVLEM